MKVSELILVLQKLPQDLTIVLYDNEWGTYDDAATLQEKQLVLYDHYEGNESEATKEAYEAFYSDRRKISERTVILLESS